MISHLIANRTFIYKSLLRFRRHVCVMAAGTKVQEVQAKTTPADENETANVNTLINNSNTGVKDASRVSDREDIINQIRRKMMSSISPAKIQDLQPMNMPQYGMKHGVRLPDVSGTYFNVTCLSRKDVDEDNRN